MPSDRVAPVRQVASSARVSSDFGMDAAHAGVTLGCDPVIEKSLKGDGLVTPNQANERDGFSLYEFNNLRPSALSQSPLSKEGLV